MMGRLSVYSGERIFASNIPVVDAKSLVLAFSNTYLISQSKTLDSYFRKKGPIRSQKSKKFKESISSFGSVNGILFVRI
jgi:hypothetical protein